MSQLANFTFQPIVWRCKHALLMTASNLTGSRVAKDLNLKIPPLWRPVLFLTDQYRLSKILKTTHHDQITVKIHPYIVQFVFQSKTADHLGAFLVYSTCGIFVFRWIVPLTSSDRAGIVRPGGFIYSRFHYCGPAHCVLHSCGYTVLKHTHTRTHTVNGNTMSIWAQSHMQQMHI